MEFDFADEDEEFRKELRAFLIDRLPDRWIGVFEGPQALDICRSITRELAERDWLTMLWPREYGGQEASVWRQTVLQEELLAFGEPRGSQYMGVSWIGPALMRFGTEEQREKFLPRIAVGELQWSQLFSEPDAGSDLAAIRTTAYLDGEEFVINGEKVWSSYAHFADYGVLIARSQPGSARRVGLSTLLIDLKTPGIDVREIRSALGWHRLCSVTFTDVRVPATALLGDLHNGWEVAMTALSFERTGSARYARATRVLGFIEDTPESKSEVIQDQIVDALSFGRMTELFNYDITARKEVGAPLTWEPSAARICNTLYEQQVARIAERVFGTLSLVTLDDQPSPGAGEVEPFVGVQARTATITAGAYEIQMGLVANRGLGLARE